MSLIKLSHPTRKINTTIQIPGSKSESNRLLILQALCGNKLNIENLSTARDTQHLAHLLSTKADKVNVLDAGTSMRFLTAYYCATGQHKMITGTPRMCERPIYPLVNALLDLGFDVHYLGKEGFPPLEIHPTYVNKLESEVFMEGNISSQFITAMLLIAPFLPHGLKISFTTPITSRPYIEMTLGILNHFGVSFEWTDNFIQVNSTSLKMSNYKVGGDWSSASYWYSIAFLAEEADIFIEGLKDDWSQGDREVADWFRRFGVLTTFTDQGARLQKTSDTFPHMMKMNFSDHPDIAQTFAAMFAAKNIYATFSGIESLKIKETDRVAALQSELKKMNVYFDYAEAYDFYQLKGNFQLPTASVDTHNDHRMAMSFAPLALLGEVTIENPEVVQKSYPSFWGDLEKAGFVVKQS